MTTLRCRFESKYEVVENSCWEWKASRTKEGYGHFFLNGKMEKAHRVSYEMNVGPLGEQQVLHHCDNPPCVNPAHLFLGSNKDNVMDKVSKNRQQRLLGDSNGRAKLTPNDVLKIRDDYKNGEKIFQIHKRYMGIGRETIAAVVHGRSWQNV